MLSYKGNMKKTDFIMLAHSIEVNNSVINFVFWKSQEKYILLLLNL